MDDLVTWLKAQLDADERVARAAADNDGNLRWRVTHDALAQRFTVRTGSNRPVLRAQVADSEADEDGVYDPHATFDPSATAEHAARWDPARVLAEIDAKRRIIDMHAPVVDGTQDSWAWFEGSESKSSTILRLLALPLADRRGYREEWRP